MVQSILTIGAVYLGAGALWAGILLFAGLERIDPAARGSTTGFRLIVVPGLVVLWPLLLRRSLAGGPPPVERNAHRAGAGKAGP